MKRLLTIVALVWFAGAGMAWSQEPFRAAADRPVDVQHIKLDLEVSIADRRVAGSATIDFTPLRPVRTLTLDAVDHEIFAVRETPPDDDGNNGRKLAFENTGTHLLITFENPLPVGKKRRIVIEYQVRDPKSGLHFFQPTEAEPDVPFIVWSQGEPTANRRWFPCFDHPNERQSTELIATVDRGFEVLSNGELLSRETSADGKQVRFHWKQTKPHVAYLVSLVVGRFAVEREEWRGLPVLYYVPPDRADEIRPTFGRTLEMLDFFSERFGIDYPWEKYAQVVVEQFTAGGMENTSATTLYDRVLHDRRALLDSSPDWLIAHELGHQWWGNLVTCKDWSHLWLNEGFATYCEVLWAEHKLGPDERDFRLYEKSRSARSGAARTRPVVDRHYPSPGSMFDTRAYPKGGWILHMLRRQLGDDDFFRVLQRYGTVHAYQTAETSDLRKQFAQLTGLSLERFFYDWTERPGHPELNVKTAYLPGDKLLRIDLEQTQSGEAFHFPLAMEFVVENASPIEFETYVTEKKTTAYVPASRRPVLVRVDPQFALLAEIRETKSRDWWQQQLLAAPTVPERLRAAEHFGKSKTNADRELLIQALNRDDFYGVRAAAASALGSSGGDVSRDALIAGLRQEIPQVRRACAEALAKFAEDAQVEEVLSAGVQQGDESYFVEAALVDSLSQVQRSPSLEPLLDALERDSYGNVIRQAALRGLGRADAPEALDHLLQWTQRGNSPAARATAIRQTAAFIRRNEVSAARQTAAVESLTRYLQGERPQIRQAAADALGNLSAAARPAQNLLETLAEHDPERRVRSAAQSALEKLKTDAPPAAELNRLRREVEALRKAGGELEDRLQRLEAK